MKYLVNRGLSDQPNRKVWAFLGDGEMDEPESLGAIGLAGRGVWITDLRDRCNLQRLDGPVRGNAKIVQNSKSVPWRRLERNKSALGRPVGSAVCS